MPWQHLGAPVAEVCRERCAGTDGVPHLFGGGGRVADSDADARFTQVFDKSERTRHFRRERDDSDASTGDVLAALEVVDRRGGGVFAPMGAARAVLGRDVGPLHVEAQDRRRVGLQQRPRTPFVALERPRDDRGQDARDTVTPQRGEGVLYLLG